MQTSPLAEGRGQWVQTSPLLAGGRGQWVQSSPLAGSRARGQWVQTASADRRRWKSALNFVWVNSNSKQVLKSKSEWTGFIFRIFFLPDLVVYLLNGDLRNGF